MTKNSSARQLGESARYRMRQSRQPENQNQKRRNEEQQQIASEIKGEAVRLCVDRYIRDRQPAAGILEGKPHTAHIPCIQRHGDSSILRKEFVEVVLHKGFQTGAGLQGYAHTADASRTREWKT